MSSVGLPEVPKPPISTVEPSWTPDNASAMVSVILLITCLSPVCRPLALR